MKEPLFPKKVSLQEPDHKYYDESGSQYMSFSAVFEFLAAKFDANKIAYFTGGKSEQGMMAKLDEWDAKRAEGVRIDAALDKYAKEGKVDDSDKDIEDAVKTILGTYPKPSYEQLIVYNEQYRVAGTIDKLTLTSNRKDSKFTVSDFKCFEDFNIHTSRKWLKAPFDHLPNSKFIKISFQLSFYAMLLELLTGKKCDGLFIHLIDPRTCKGGGEIKQERVYIPYLKNDILILLETFKEQIKAELTNKNEFVI
jgi:hypothetical protein